MILTRDGKTLSLGDTGYYNDTVDVGWWADDVALMQYMGEEGYSVSLYNGDEGCICETVIDEDDLVLWEAENGN